MTTSLAMGLLERAELQAFWFMPSSIARQLRRTCCRYAFPSRTLMGSVYVPELRMLIRLRTLPHSEVSSQGMSQRMAVPRLEAHKSEDQSDSCLHADVPAQISSLRPLARPQGCAAKPASIRLRAPTCLFGAGSTDAIEIWRLSSLPSLDIGAHLNRAAHRYGSALARRAALAHWASDARSMFPR